MSRYTKPTLQKLELVFRELQYLVRYEKGNFNSGYCIVETNKVVVVNRFFDTDARVSVLLDILQEVLTDDSVLTEKSRVLIRHLQKTREGMAIRQEPEEL